MTPIQNILSGLQPRTDAKPVIFNGFRPRHVGYAVDMKEAYRLGIIQRVATNYTSTARCNMPDGSVSGEFYLLHG